LLAGYFTLPDWNSLLLFSLLLLLAYRPVREAARHYPSSLAGAAALRAIDECTREWEVFPRRQTPDTHPHRNALALRGVDFAYDKRRAVFTGFSVELPADQVTGVTGPNGAGKTTMLRLLSGAETPAAGMVQWSAEAVAHGIAYLPQRAWPGADWAEWARGMMAQSPEQWRDLNVLLRLDRLVDKSIHPEALSGGERQRMALARTLASDAAYLLLDEPVTALPGDERENILRGALEFWKNPPASARVSTPGTRDAEEKAHRGALVVSHELFLAKLCDSVMRLEVADRAGSADLIPAERMAP
jgi:sulfonate transport system ATP-binding protein